MLRPLMGALIALLVISVPALAEEGDEAAKPWSNETELGFVTTSGNNETSSLSFKTDFQYRWSRSTLQVKGLAVRSEKTTRIVENVGGQLSIDEESETTAELYQLGVQFDYELNERLSAYGRAGWERNRLAGIENRHRYGGGLGYQAIENEVHKLKLEAGADFIDEETVSGVEDDFAAARAFAGYEWKFSENGTFAQALELLQNLDESDDFRANSETSVTASLTNILALKASYTVLYDAQPVVEVVSAPGFDDVIFEFDEVDTIFAVSLVINF